MAGEYTVRISNSWNFGNRTIGGVTAIINPDSIIGFSHQVPANKTDEPIIFSVDPTKATAVAFQSDQDCSIKFYDDAGTPALITDIGATGVFALKKGQPVFWRTNDAHDNPLDGAGHSKITLIKITTGTIATQFDIEVGIDATAGI
jgi:hypothetical protein